MPQAENMTNPDLGTWLTGKLRLLRNSSEFPSIELNAIAAHILQKNQAWIISHPETRLESPQLLELDNAFNRLINGEPLAYITGRRSFFGLDFEVNQHVLVPRPETELMVEMAIEWLEQNPGRWSIADIGTGSGAIAVALADRFDEANITAIDRSSDALLVAQANAARYHLTERVNFVQSDLLTNVDDQFDLILANLPYIPSQALDELPGLDYEPRTALDGGLDGLDLIRDLIATCPKNLCPKACMFLEIQYNQDKAVKEIAQDQFPQAMITIHQDLALLPRVVKIQL